MSRWSRQVIVARAVVSIALGTTLLLGPTAARTNATTTPVLDTPSVAPGVVAHAEAAANVTWARNDPKGDQRATAAMRKRFPRKSRAVDISRQRYAHGIGGLTIVTHLRRVIKGKAPYRQYVHQVVIGYTDGTLVEVHLKGRFRGSSTITTSTGQPCTGSVFSVDRRSDIAVAYVPASCLPRTMTRIRTTSFNEHGPTDIVVDRMNVAVPR